VGAALILDSLLKLESLHWHRRRPHLSQWESLDLRVPVVEEDSKHQIEDRKGDWYHQKETWLHDDDRRYREATK
jgi:hypothetical protein